MKKLYVGNLPWSTSDSELRAAFEEYGEVHSARVMTDRDTGRSRGFGFVEMDDDAAESAISAMNGRQMGGRAIVVNEARQDERRSGGGYRGR